MNKSRTLIKGILSTVVGAVAFYFILFNDNNMDLFDSLLWLIVSSVLGYFFVSALIMSDKE